MGTKIDRIFDDFIQTGQIKWTQKNIPGWAYQLSNK